LIIANIPHRRKNPGNFYGDAAAVCHQPREWKPPT
jgi:hypothetical protein